VTRPDEAFDVPPDFGGGALDAIGLSDGPGGLQERRGDFFTMPIARIDPAPRPV
jgi:hypothetical protein